MQEQECRQILRTLGRIKDERPQTVATYGKQPSAEKPGKKFSPFYITGVQ